MPEWLFIGVSAISFVMRLLAFVAIMVVLREFVDALRLNGRILKRLIGVFASISFLIIWTMVPDAVVFMHGSGLEVLKTFFWYLRPFGFIPYGCITVSTYLLWRSLRKQVKPNSAPHRRWYEKDKKA